MSGFTKGPWKVTSTGDIGIDIDAPYYEALGVGVNEESPFCVIISRRHVASRLEANAHLIAAAPDLYEAVETCLSHLVRSTQLGTRGYEDDIIRIRAILAKSRGETQA